MITQEKIERFIQQVPPTPKILKETINYLNAGELVQASKIAQQDLALSAYLKELVNKPLYGFKTEVNDISQIFGILGVSRSQQAVYNYMISLLSPACWSFFNLDKNKFYNLQAELSVGWQKIMKHLGIEDKEIQSAIALLPASIIVSEALFNEKKEDVTLLRSVKDIDLNTILQRLCHKDLFDICEMIAVKWEMDTAIAQIVQAASGEKSVEDKKIESLGKWMHLHLFYILSQPPYVEAGLNDFVTFNTEYVGEIYEEFMKVMEIA